MSFTCLSFRTCALADVTELIRVASVSALCCCKMDLIYFGSRAWPLLAVAAQQLASELATVYSDD